MPADNKRILAIFAHPDDMELMCAGTLARLAAKGYQITSMTLTPGDCSSRTLPTDEISDIRQKECQNSVKIIKGEYLCLPGGRDGAINLDADTRKKITDYLRRIDPFIVFTHPPGDPMLDHDVTSALVRDACFHASIPNYRTINQRATQTGIPYLYYVDTLEGLDLYGSPVPVEIYVDITEVFANKQKMFSCHQSQFEFEDARWQVEDKLADMVRWSGTRGTEVGVKQAEAFRQHKAAPFPRDNILDRILKTLTAPTGKPTLSDKGKASETTDEVL